MCSTPKPKRSSQGKSLASSTSILAAMSRTQRQAFSDRANKASERRASQLKTKQKEAQCSNKHSQLKHNPLRAQQNRVKMSWIYWLVSTSLTDVMQKFIKH
jgi:hypothetical protein